MSLWNTEARYLDKYIEDHLLPDTNFRLEVRHAIHIICSFLKERCFRHTGKSIRVAKVVKGGSSGKGTALKGRSDADLVVFLTNLKSYRDQINHRKEIILEIRKQLEACSYEEEDNFKVTFEVNKWANPRVLSFTLSSNKIHEEVDFDVLPAFDALGQLTSDFEKPDPQVYINLLNESEKGGEFSTCFTELQRAFLRNRCTKLKSLIRLVKHWYKMCQEEIDSLPPQYALVLLTVYAWEHGSGKTYFNIAEGFRTVLYLIQQYQYLKIYWLINYDFQNRTLGNFLHSQLQKPRPVILDPADPTGDVGGGDKWNWDELAAEAEYWLRAPCLHNWDGSLVKRWLVPLEQTSEEDYFPTFELENTYPTLNPERTLLHCHLYNDVPAQEGWNCTIL